MSGADGEDGLGSQAAWGQMLICTYQLELLASYLNTTCLSFPICEVGCSEGYMS